MEFERSNHSSIHKAFNLWTRSILFGRNGSSGSADSRQGGSSRQGLRNEAARFASLDRLPGGSFGGCTMREPRLDDLTVDEAASAQLRGALAREKNGEDHRHDRYEKPPRSQGSLTANGGAVSSPGQPGAEDGSHEAGHHGVATGPAGARSEEDETNPGCLSAYPFPAFPHPFRNLRPAPDGAGLRFTPSPSPLPLQGGEDQKHNPRPGTRCSGCPLLRKMQWASATGDGRGKGEGECKAYFFSFSANC